MADSLCGPSNSLQSFQKHTSVDRTLQQDRLATLEPPTEAFRSTSGLNTAVLDEEFEAFQSGSSLDNRLPGYDFYEAPNSFVAKPDYTEDPGWASGLQNLHIDGPQQPIPQSQFRERAPLHRGSQGGWHHEFLRQQNRASVQDTRQQLPSAGHQFSPSTYRHDIFNTYTPMQIQQPISAISQLSPSHHAYSNLDLPVFSGVQRVQPIQETNDALDDAALERAFDAVHQELRQSGDFLQGEGIEYGQDSALSKNVIQNPTHISGARGALLDERIGSDTILDGTDKEKQGKNEADELARTAGELLNSVKHDQSPKFRQSNFLSLMRQLRDREVQVEGDKIVDVSNSLPQT